MFSIEGVISAQSIISSERSLLKLDLPEYSNDSDSIDADDAMERVYFYILCIPSQKNIPSLGELIKISFVQFNIFQDEIIYLEDHEISILESPTFPISSNFSIAPLHGDPSSVINYKGSVILKKNLVQYNLDNGAELLSSACLDERQGKEIIFHNLTMKSQYVWLFCPYFSSSSHPAIFTSILRMSLCDFHHFYNQRSNIKECLANLVHSSYFEDEKKYERLVRKMSEALFVFSSKEEAFASHCIHGYCSSCRSSIYTILPSISSLKTNNNGDLIPLLLGTISICKMTGRYEFVSGCEKYYLIYKPEIKVILWDSLESLVFLLNSSLLRSNVRHIQVNYILVGEVMKIISLSRSMRPESNRNNSMLFIACHVGVPLLLNHNDVMKRAIKIKLCGILEWKSTCTAFFSSCRKSIEKTIDLNAADVESMGLSSGSFLIEEPTLLRSIFFHPGINESESLRVVKENNSSIALCANPKLLLELDRMKESFCKSISEKLLDPRLIPELIFKTILVESIDAQRLGLPNVNPSRGSLNLFKNWYIGLPNTQYHLINAEFNSKETKVVIPPNCSMLYPLGLEIGAIFRATFLSSCQSKLGTVLLPTCNTEFILISNIPDDAQIFQKFYSTTIWDLVNGKVNEHLLQLEGSFIEIINVNDRNFKSAAIFSDGTGQCHLYSKERLNIDLTEFEEYNVKCTRLSNIKNDPRAPIILEIISFERLNYVESCNLLKSLIDQGSSSH